MTVNYWCDKEFGEEIKKRRESMLSAKEAAELFSKYTGLAVETAQCVISKYEDGLFYGTSSRSGIVQNREKYLRRLIIYLQDVLKITQDDIEKDELFPTVTHIQN